jgi:kumamolisin
MPVNDTDVAVAGSERVPLPGAKLVGPVDPNEQMSVTVLVRRRADANPVNTADLGGRPPAERQHVTREEFAGARGADPQDLARVEEFARAHGLTVTESSPERRSVVLSGRAADFSAAFNVELNRYEHPEGSYRGRQGPVTVPGALAGLVEGVFGLDDRPQAQPHFRPASTPIAAASGSFSARQVAALYQFPAGGTGQGQCIGIIELGGGYTKTDLDSYFQRLGLATPTVTAVGVDGAANTPTGNPNSADGEVMLDIEVAGAVAPGARIAVYFAPNTDRGFLDAVGAALHDNQNKPSVISISWGGAESTWTAQAQQAMEQVFVDAATLGITVCAAAGDNGSADGVGDGLAHVDFPASSPHVLACGGTHLEASGATISRELVWNDGKGGATGGGISQTFDPPPWQLNAHVPLSVNPDRRAGRGVPDVAGDADPASGYQIEVDGANAVFGGTSAVAPLWAGLIALINQQLGHPAGYLNPILYGRAATIAAFHDITSGTNAITGTQGYSAGPGWDACTGLGTPNGQALLTALEV